MKSHAIFRFIPFLIIFFALFGACTDESSVIDVRSELDLEMEGLAFNRRHIAVPAGERVLLHLQNVDTYTHYFAVYASEAAEQVLIEKVEIPAHSIVDYEFTAPEEPGRYYFQDDSYAHKMNGVFIVSEQRQVPVD